MTIATTYAPGYIHDKSDLTQLPFLRESEYAGICDALADGRLVALVKATPGGYDDGNAARAEIIGALTPDAADAYLTLVEDAPARDKRAEKIAAEVESAREELRTLREIVGEVMAEKSPADFRDRIGYAIDDVANILDNVTAMAEEL